MNPAKNATPTYNLTVLSPGPDNPYPRQSTAIDRAKVFKNSKWIKEHAGNSDVLTLNISPAFGSHMQTWYLFRCFVHWLMSGKIETKLHFKDADAGYLKLWQFGHEIQAPKFQNAVLLSLCGNKNALDNICGKDIKWLYERVEKTAPTQLRDHVLLGFCVDHVVFRRLMCDDDDTLFDDVVSFGDDLAVKIAKETIEHALDQALHRKSAAAINPIRRLNDYLFDTADMKFVVDDVTDGMDGDAEYEYEDETDSEEESDLECETDLENDSDSETVVGDESALETDEEETDEEASDSDDTDDSDEDMTEVEADGEGVAEIDEAPIMLRGLRKSGIKVWTGL